MCRVLVKPLLRVRDFEMNMILTSCEDKIPEISSSYALLFKNVRPRYVREVSLFPLVQQPRSSLRRPVLRFLDHTQLDTHKHKHARTL